MTNHFRKTGTHVALIGTSIILCGALIYHTQAQVVPLATAQESPANQQTLKEQIEVLVEHTKDTTKSYGDQWSNGNTPLTFKVLQLYGNTMVDAVRDSLEHSLKTPLTSQQVLELQNSIDGFIGHQYSVVRVGKLDSLPPDATISEKSEYRSEIVLRLWEKQGKNLMRELWSQNLSDGLVTFSSVSLSDEQKMARKADVEALPAFIKKEMLNRFPKVQPEELDALGNDYLKDALKSIDDPTSPLLKQPTNRTAWRDVLSQTFDTDERLKNMVVGKEELNLREVYTVLWFALLKDTVIIPKQIPTSVDSKSGTNLMQYFKAILDNPDTALHDFAVESPTVNQKWQEHEAASWFLRFGTDVKLHKADEVNKN